MTTAVFLSVPPLNKWINFNSTLVLFFYSRSVICYTDVTKGGNKDVWLLLAVFRLAVCVSVPLTRILNIPLVVEWKTDSSRMPCACDFYCIYRHQLYFWTSIRLKLKHNPVTLNARRRDHDTLSQRTLNVTASFFFISASDTLTQTLNSSFHPCLFFSALMFQQMFTHPQK